MVTRRKANAAPEIEISTGNRSLATHAQRTDEQSTQAFAFTDNLIGDDLIVALANAYENKRARQVGEWERLRHQSVRLSV